MAEFIARRRQELSAEEAELRQRLEVVRSELKGLEEAEAAAERSKTPESELKRAIRKRASGIKPGTIMESIVNILSEHESGLSAMEILKEIRTRGTHGMLKRESLSPQLSRLRQSGYIDLEGSIWMLTKKETE